MLDVSHLTASSILDCMVSLFHGDNELALR